MTDQGPIEYVGRKKLRPPKQPKVPKRPRVPGRPTVQPSDVRPAAGKAAKAPAKKTSRWAWLYVVAVIVGLMAAFVGYVFLGTILRPMYVSGACELSACSTGGMVIAGWLVIAVPAALIGATAIVQKLAGRTTRRVLLGLTIASVLMALSFVPGRRRRGLSDLVKGPGADQFIDGFLWALGGIGATLVAMVLLAVIGRKAAVIGRNYTVSSLVAGAVLVVTAVPVAVSATGSTGTNPEEIFPAVLQMNDDVLTRTATANQRGCDGVLADDALLNVENCVMALHVAYRTDDSDAVASLWAVLYTTSDAADAVRQALPSASTDALATIYSTNKSWLLLGTAAHADGGIITKADRPWVLWPLRQVAYRFIGFQNGLLLDPDPGDEIHPRVASR
ncbi:hypothetical protein AB0M47_23165 [Hamadaea sp. NPDC051192]|uniref:hypothetical protein n=1 Tax=Hamadaea sp. NPDC051192 TaxID=3154940 RepID=UPI003413E05A